MILQIGKLIRQLRKQQGMTQTTLGSGMMSKAEMSRIENGSREPDIFTLNALLHRLGKSLEYFEVVISKVEYERLKELEQCTDLEKGLPLKTVVILESELIKDIRQAKGWSQEQLSEDVCARETISTIETGRRALSSKKMKQLLEKLDEPMEKYYGFVVAQEFEVYEMVHRYQGMEGSEPAAEELLQIIEERIDMNISWNRQFIESSRILAKLRKGNMEVAEGLAALDKCLRYTMPEFDGVIYRIPHRQEAVILETMLDCLKKLGQEETAKDLEQNFFKKIGKKLKVSQNVTAFLIKV